MLDTNLFLGFLLVVAAGLGWLAGRLIEQRKKIKKSAIPPAEYYRGLNYLLRDESDKALSVLKSMAQADSGVAEVHFALGTLFRRRGETDRAIRIHQNLLAQPGLARRHREHALFSLAEDYYKAGLFDRAEALFVQAKEQGIRQQAALQKLISIYELQCDWRQAIDVRRQLAGQMPGDHDEVIAHYHCELACQARDANDLVKMREQLKKARQSHREIARGSLMRADLAILQDDLPLAVKLYKRILQSNPEMAALILLRLQGCLDPASPEYSRILADALRRQPELSDHLAKAALATRICGNDVLIKSIRSYIANDPALTALSESYEANYSELAAMLHSIGLARLNFRCMDCGYFAEEMFWQCPACQSWSSAQPDIKTTAMSPVR
ncbi:MAG: tetratricopeptide repeat protein [Gammaproteobacteria bacterium]|nr:tetratricopeptide repeat protein [Gammaproteobacteria bacterium]